MRTPSRIALFLLGASALAAAPDPHWLDHDRERPLPAPVVPGIPSTPDRAGTAPSDAVVLFDGRDISQWVAMDGSPTKWIIHDGALECVPGSGFVRSLRSFGDCQLHIEWATPVPATGNSQDRGNSGVFFGYDRYECQVLDSYQNKTYADGSAASIYGQYPPLVNASLPPGAWQTYDIIWETPRFDAEGKLISPAHETVFHNGVLVQNHVALTGPTSWLERAPYKAHPERLPIALQDHGHPVRYRNIWVRELGNPRRPEYMLADTVLDSYVGTYGTPGTRVEVRKGDDGLLLLKISGVELTLHAGSQTRFFALTTDVQCEFRQVNGRPEADVTVGDDDSRAMRFVRSEP